MVSVIDICIVFITGKILFVTACFSALGSLSCCPLKQLLQSCYTPANCLSRRLYCFHIVHQYVCLSFCYILIQLICSSDFTVNRRNLIFIEEVKFLMKKTNKNNVIFSEK